MVKQRQPWMCGAKSKRSGELCRRAAMKNGKCMMHGGKSLKGIASPSFKHGRYSRHAPHLPQGAMGNAYKCALNDRELLALREEIALTDAAIVASLEAMKAVPEDEPSRAMACRAELAGLMDQRRKLVESERKRHLEAQEILTAEQARMLFAEIVMAVRRHVTDRQVLAAISADFARLAVE
jgi:hypothetical protein